MILYLEFDYSDYSIDRTKFETKKINLDLIGSDISTVSFEPGIISDLTQIGQAIVNISIHGRPALTHASIMIGRFRTHAQLTLNRNFGSFVYLWYSPTDDRQLYKSRVYTIDLTPEGTASFYNVPDRNIPAQLIINHGPWIGELIQIPLAHSYGTTQLTPLTIQNTTDATYDNRVYIRGTDVAGDLPTPIKIELINNDNTRIYQYWYGLNVNSTPQLFNHVVEGEDGAPLNNQISADASAGASNQISVAATAEADMITWDLDANFTTQANGNQFHLLIRTHASNWLWPQIYYRFKILDAAGVGTFWKGEQVFFPNANINNFIGDYGIIRIPPWRVDRNIVSPSAVKLVMSAAQIVAGAAIPQDIDALYLFPVDGFRKIIFDNYLDQNETLIDDMTEDFIYTTPAGGGSIGSVFAIGNPILVHPGLDQSLYILQDNDDGGTAEFESTIRIWYRPTRLTI